MTPNMAFEGLLVSRDPAVVSLFRPILRDLSIGMNICLRASNAIRLIAEGGMDLVLIDIEADPDYSNIVSTLPESNSWRKPTVVMIREFNLRMDNAYHVIRKPLTAESVAKSLQSAHSTMLREHRRYVRHALMTSLFATDQNGRKLQTTITDIGYGGLGLSGVETLAVGDILTCHCMLPGLKRTISLQIRVIWTRAHGIAGCDFIRIPTADHSILLDWLQMKDQIKSQKKSHGIPTSIPEESSVQRSTIKVM